MLIRAFLSAVTAVLVLSGPGVAQAQTAPAPDAVALMQKMVGAAPVNSVASACYARVYDAAHLAAHPLQKVTQMTVAVRADTRSEEGGVTYSFVTGLKKRGGKQLLTGSGGCNKLQAQEGKGPVSKIGCGVDCDGGGLSIEPGKTAGSVIVRIDDFIAVSASNPNASDDDEPAEREGIKAGADDRVFRLDRVAIEQCRKLFDSKDAYDDFVTAK